MHQADPVDTPTIKVRETELSPSDTRQQYREKIARITLDSMVQFVGLLDAKGTVLEINHVALNAVGISLPDVEGKPFWTTFWWQVSEEINKTLRDSIARAATGEFVRWDTPIYGRANGKETIIIDASLAPVVDTRGEVVFICAEGRDITEKKAQEREIAQKNLELQGLLERIRELDEIKTQFFANVSHELRTPLALIIGPAERLLKGNAGNGEQTQEAAQTIVRNAKMLLKHVNDLLDISKLEAKKLKINLQQANVGELIRFVSSHFELLAKEKDVRFEVETKTEVHSAVDTEKLQRVVMNLLSNAFKFVPTGGTVRCTLTVTPAELLVMVEDSGPGVKPELRRVIFERFRQGDGATNRQFAGTGLGLAIAHEFVTMHKGAIEVLTSDLGGALFQVRLPLTHSTSLDTAEPSAMDNSTLEGLIEELRVPATAHARDNGKTSKRIKERVLIVEDNPEMNRFISQSLADEFEVRSAFDGDEGLQAAQAFLPSIIVTDIMMPNVSGVQMIERLRENPDFYDTPILLLSAKADEDLKIKLLSESAQDYITKPFSEQDLLVRVRNLITIKTAREAVRETERNKRKAVEKQNQELQSKYRQLGVLFEQTPSFMVVLRGPQHTFEFANKSFYNLVGDRELIGKPAREAFPEIEGQGFFELLDQVLATGKPFRGTGLPASLQRQRDLPLEKRYVDFVFQPLFDEGSLPSGIFVEGHDATEEVLAKEALREQSSMLEQQVHERTKALKELNKSLKMSNEDLQQFAHVASHDLKEPVRKIKTYSTRLQDEYHDILPEKGGTFLNKILSATDRVYSMIDGVLLYSTLVAEIQPVETVDLNKVMRDIESDLEVLIQEKKATLVVEKLPQLAGVSVLLYQLFYNLVNNAIKFSRKEVAPVIHVKFARKKVDDREFARITLSDNGIGFDQENAEKIFGTFTRLNSKDKYEGTGLGLALCRKIAQRHGGSISAVGDKSKGAEFTVLLPLN